VHRTSAGAARAFGSAAPTADSASGGFVRQIPRLPVTPAVRRLLSSLYKSMKKVFVIFVVALVFVCLSACETTIQNTSVEVSETNTIQPTKLNISPSLTPTTFNTYTPEATNTIIPPTPTIETNTYYDPELKIKISYPKDWAETSKGVFVGKNGYVTIKKLENYNIPDMAHTATDFANTVYSKYKPNVYCMGYVRNGCAITMKSPNLSGVEVSKVISIIPYYWSKDFAKYFLIETTEQYFLIIDDLLTRDRTFSNTPTDSKNFAPIPTPIETNFQEGLSLQESSDSPFSSTSESNAAKGITTYTNCGIENKHRNLDFSMSRDRSRITIKQLGETIYEYASPAGIENDTPWSFCTWDNNWMMETYDIVIINGQVLNHKLGFDRVFGWHMLGDKQIYFVEKNNKYQISFDGKLIPVKYDEIFHYGCCAGTYANPLTNGVKTWFRAKRDNVWFMVIVSLN
jgi:hypothetical protein